MSFIWPWKSKEPKSRGLGWMPNEADERDRSWHPIVSARPARYPEVSLERYIPTVLDQVYTSSCVGQAVESTVAIRQAYLGLGYDPPSARGIYTLARASHGAAKDDGGTYPRKAWKMFARHGCPLKSQWPWKPRAINDIPPSTMLLNGFRHSGMRYEHIFEVGTAKLDRIKLAIGEGLPVFFGTDVYADFGSYRAGFNSPPYTPGTTRIMGGHAMVIVGWRETDGALRVLNSWGTSWGDRGLMWADPEWAVADWRDLTVAYGWPADWRRRPHE